MTLTMQTPNVVLSDGGGDDAYAILSYDGWDATLIAVAKFANAHDDAWHYANHYGKPKPFTSISLGRSLTVQIEGALPEGLDGIRVVEPESIPA